MKELYDLGQRYMKKGDPSIPQLRYGNQYISLEKLVSDQQFIFDRLKNRICNLENNKELLKKPCESPYNLFVESIVYHHMICNIDASTRRTVLPWKSIRCSFDQVYQ